MGDEQQEPNQAARGGLVHCGSARDDRRARKGFGPDSQWGTRAARAGPLLAGTRAREGERELASARAPVVPPGAPNREIRKGPAAGNRGAREPPSPDEERGGRLERVKQDGTEGQ